MHPWPPSEQPPRRGLSGRSRMSIGSVLALLVAACVLMLDPGEYGSRVRGLVGLDDERRMAAVPFSGEGTYRFLATQPGGEQPVGWNPCRPVRYQVNPQDAPEDWRELVDDGVAEVSAATGLEFQDEGTTDDRGFDDRSGGIGIGGPDPVLIGWADEDEVEGLAGDVAGLAGPVTLSRAGYGRYVSGMVVLDADTYADLDGAVGGRAQQRAILIHELGHLVGLAHVDDEGELMHATNLGRTEFGPGDLTGLALLGRVPCS